MVGTRDKGPNSQAQGHTSGHGLYSKSQCGGHLLGLQNRVE